MPNRLAQAQSLYLRKHADNPIDWWPWCDEALAIAKQDNKPIFLSIGYSSCHWCTVMEGEAFSDLAIAEYMNTHFLPIKVDREERPDIDSIYMQTLQMMTGQGGWPLNVFLSPDDLVPFFGGTYFPMEPMYGRPGFLQVLQGIRRFYDTEAEKVQSVKEQILGNLQQAATLEIAEPEAGPLNGDLLYQGLQYSAGVLTNRSPGPRFPMIPYASAALRGTRFSISDAQYDARTVCQQRGLDLALGGIYDHVAGGFHRYTVDPTWTVPHFEKMLYDNGQIMEFLADLWALGMQEPAFERAIAGTVQWLQREMTSPEGYFYAAQDADSFVTPDDPEPEEGAFYVWRYRELESLLSPEELAALREQFTISDNGNFEGHNVLQRQQPGTLGLTVETALEKLFTIRYGAPPAEMPTFLPARNNVEAKTKPWPGRIPAVTDTKMIVAWNSLMISGLARAAAVFPQANYLALANGAAQFILEHQQVNQRFHRLNYDGQVSVIAQSEDYALFIKALLDLHRVMVGREDTVEQALQYLAQAEQLQAEFDEYLWSDSLKGYYSTDARPDLVVRERNYDDNATPSANGVAIANLVRLFLLTENTAYLQKAEQALQSFSGIMNRAPQVCPSLFAALDWFLHPQVVRTSMGLIAKLNQQYLPATMLKLDADLPDGAIALVCEGLSCQEPARTLEQLHTQLDHRGKSQGV